MFHDSCSSCLPCISNGSRNQEKNGGSNDRSSPESCSFTLLLWNASSSIPSHKPHPREVWPAPRTHFGALESGSSCYVACLLDTLLDLDASVCQQCDEKCPGLRCDGRRS